MKTRQLAFDFHIFMAEWYILYLFVFQVKKEEYKNQDLERRIQNSKQRQNTNEQWWYNQICCKSFIIFFVTVILFVL